MSKQTSRLVSVFLLSFVFGAVGCGKIWSTPHMQQESSPMSTTGVSAAAGAAIGAGVGALIGSATGNAGEGLVLGAVAGAAFPGTGQTGHHPHDYYTGRSC